MECIFSKNPKTGVCSKIPRSDLELPEVSEFGESRDISPPVKFGTGHWNSLVVPLDPDAHIIEPSARGKGKGQMQGLLECGYWDPRHVLFHTVGQESTMTVGSCVSFPLGSSNRQLITVILPATDQKTSIHTLGFGFMVTTNMALLACPFVA